MKQLITFEYQEDEQFFRSLLCTNGEPFSNYSHLFDFRSVPIKRREFNAQRNKLLTQLQSKYGSTCQLCYPTICQLTIDIVIDHLIPLSSNVLNKTLRSFVATSGRKVASQNLGSNHIDNLIVACSACNNHKKHRFLAAEHIQRILKNRQ